MVIIIGILFQGILILEDVKTVTVSFQSKVSFSHILLINTYLINAFPPDPHCPPLDTYWLGIEYPTGYRGSSVLPSGSLLYLACLLRFSFCRSSPTLSMGQTYPFVLLSSKFVVGSIMASGTSGLLRRRLCRLKLSSLITNVPALLVLVVYLLCVMLFTSILETLLANKTFSAVILFLCGLRPGDLSPLMLGVMKFL